MASLGASGTALAAGGAKRSDAAIFRVGAAVATIDPAYPVYLGGYGGGPAGGTIALHHDVLTGRSEHLTVRAIAIAQGSHVVELATVDTQGYMAGYDEGPYGLTTIRQEVADWLATHGAPGADESNIIISSLHEHAAPTLFGIWGPMSHQVPYLKRVAEVLRATCERAYASARAATLEWGTASAPWLGGGNIAEGNEFEGWPRAGFLLALRARDAHTGKTIATYTSEPAYPNIVFGPQDLVAEKGKSATQISPDFPWYANEMLSQRLGGVSIVASSTLSNQASPQQADSAPSPDLPRVNGQRQTRAFDDAVQMASVVTNLTEHALAGAHPVTDPTIASAEQHIISPVDNPALLALNYLDSDDIGEKPVGALTQKSIYPAARSTKPPYAYVAALGTWVTALRIGKLAFLSEPGEFAAPIHWTWQQSIHGADAVAVVGAAQDFLGYEYPAYTSPFTLMGGDEHIFNPGVELGDQVTLAGQQEAQALGFDVDLTKSPETSATDNDYTQVTRPGALILPSAVYVSLDSRGEARVRFEASAQVPRIRMTCSNPALLVAPPGCMAPEDAMHAFHWDFGDGTRLVTPVQAHVRAFFSPFVNHVYRAPGRYRVTVWSVDDNGMRATDTRTIVVSPHTAEG